MRVTTGTVVGGKAVVEGVPLVEGSVVAVRSREPEEPFTLSPEDELLAAMAEIETGEFVSVRNFLRDCANAANATGVQHEAFAPRFPSAA